LSLLDRRSNLTTVVDGLSVARTSTLRGLTLSPYPITLNALGSLLLYWLTFSRNFKLAGTKNITLGGGPLVPVPCYTIRKFKRWVTSFRVGDNFRDILIPLTTTVVAIHEARCRFIALTGKVRYSRCSHCL